MNKPVRKADTALAAAFDRAGFDVAAARLRTMAQEALCKCHGNEQRAANAFRLAVGADTDLWLQLLRLAKTAGIPGEGHDELGAQRITAQARNLNGDDGGQHARDTRHELASASPTPRDDASQSSFDTHSRTARAAREPSAADLAAAAHVGRAAALTVLDTRKTSTGQPWGDVGAHELDGMDRDGTIARAVKGKLGPLTNEQRFKTLRELMTPALFDKAWAEARGENHGA